MTGAVAVTLADKSPNFRLRDCVYCLKTSSVLLDLLCENTFREAAIRCLFRVL